MSVDQLFKQTAEQMKDANQQVADAEAVIEFQKEIGAPTAEAVAQLSDLKRKKESIERALKKRNLM